MTAPTENTGNEGLREAIIKIWQREFNPDKNPEIPEDLLDDLLALIRQDRRELLERLKAQQELCYDCVHDHIYTDHDRPMPFIALKVIDAELQHGAESGEA